MHTITLTSKTNKKGNISLKANTPFKYEEVEVVLVINKKNTLKHNFEDLVGKLQWKGDAIKEQRRLRKEWSQ